METLDYSWEEDMRTGDEVLDLQHKELIYRLNLLLHAMYKGQVTEEVESMLEFLDSYIVEHFTYEEACMDRVRCPLALANRKAHAEFLKRLYSFRAEMSNNPSTVSLVAVKMLRDLSEWLVVHILHIDARLLPYVQAHLGNATGASN
jgi:hemerythrin